MPLKGGAPYYMRNLNVKEGRKYHLYFSEIDLVTHNLQIANQFTIFGSEFKHFPKKANINVHILTKSLKSLPKILQIKFISAIRFLFLNTSQKEDSVT